MRPIFTYFLSGILTPVVAFLVERFFMIRNEVFILHQGEHDGPGPFFYLGLFLLCFFGVSGVLVLIIHRKNSAAEKGKYYGFSMVAAFVGCLLAITFLFAYLGALLNHMTQGVQTMQQ